MRKSKLIFIVVVVFLSCVILTASINRPYLYENEEMKYLSMKIAVLESEEELMDSNGCVLKALYAIQDIKKHEKYNNQAIDLLINVQEKMKNVISSPNFFEEKIQDLQKQYERAGEIIRKGSNKSEEEWQEFLAIETEAAYTHVYLVECSAAFSSLYSIREFDSLPDQEAKEKLQEFWWEFRFDESVECPETIDVGELYMIWAKQYFTRELEQSEIEQINLLRANDKLTSKEYNAKWMELIDKLYGTWADIQPIFFIVKLRLNGREIYSQKL